MLAADKEFTRAASAHLGYNHAAPRGQDGIAPLALASRLVSAFHTLDDAVLAASAAQGSRDGSTALVAVRCGQHLYTAHVGDTRAVAVIARHPPPRGGDLAPGTAVASTPAVRLTRDHTASCGIEAARVRAAGGNLHYAGCWRVIADDIINGNGGASLRAALAVTRALGDGAFKRRSRGPLVHSASAASLPSLHGPHGGALQQTVLATPDVARLHLKQDVVCVVCATDGLWDALSDDDAAEVALHALAACPPGPAVSAAARAQAVADALIAASLEVSCALFAANTPDGTWLTPFCAPTSPFLACSEGRWTMSRRQC
jgi:serine/threonine protein phosphatase PrpC